MSNYKIVNLVNNNIMLEFDGKRVNFPLPIVDGLYPEGTALTELLDRYVSDYIASMINVPVATNLATIEALVEPIVPTEQEIKMTRNRLLFSTDWTQVADSPLTPELKALWATYRQELRDVTSQAGFPTTVTWPVPPVSVTNGVGMSVTDVNGIPLKNI